MRLNKRSLAKMGKGNPNYQHGYSRHGGLYTVWISMKARCGHRHNSNYHNYGGRGIGVCNEWKVSFPVFRQWAISNGYGEGLQLDRIDNDGNYCPENCRWVTPSQNSRNTRRTKKIRAFGETKSVVEWANDPRCLVNSISLRTRLRRGIAPELALTAKRIIRNQFGMRAL